MLSAKRIAVAGAAALCLCAPLPAQAQKSQDLRGADARGVPTAPKPPHQSLRGADAQGMPTASELPAAQPDTRVRIVEVPSSGIELTDAGIGAAGMLALVLLGSGGAVAVSRRRGVATR